MKQTKINKLKLKNIFKIVVMVAVFTVIFIGGISAGLVAALVKEDPVRSQEEIMDKVFKNNLTGFAYFSNTKENGESELIGMLRADEDRRFIEWNEIPKDVYYAFLAIEDKEFENHNGINFKALTRALLQQATNSDVQTGGSTITQQLAKNTFYTLDQTYERKAREIFLSLRMERLMSKQDIFTAYVNKIPFGKAANGSNVYGIQAASKGYFNKDAKDLNLAEAAYLAGLPQRPTAYSAFDSNGFNDEKYNLAKGRQELVLDNMLEEKYITKQEYEEALVYDIKTAFDHSLSEKKPYNNYPYLMLEIENRAAEKIIEVQGITVNSPDYYTALDNAKQELLTGGYKVYTTVDKNIYDAMTKVAENPDNFLQPKDYEVKANNGEIISVEDGIQQVGATLVDNKTGAILGFVGGRDFNVSQVNNSNFRGSSKRQPGSSIKPILDYAPAMELGKIQPASAIDDIPLGGDWEPNNWNNKYNGRLTARDALKWSYNIPAVKVYDLVRPEKAYEYYAQLGFKENKTRFLQAGLTPAIGSLETSPEEMTAAYTTFANGGIYMDAYLIDRIEDIDGNIIYEHQPNPKPVFSEQTAYLMTDMLRTVVNNGTGTTVRQYVKGRDIAGKTGTTNDSKDLWFVGYTPEITLGVWVGYEIPYSMQYDGARASHIWGKMMAEVIETSPELSPKGTTFKQPDGLVRMEVSSTSGKLPTDLTREAGYVVTDLFNKKYIPTELDDSLERARVITYEGVRYFAKQETPDDMVQTGIYYRREPYELPFETDDEGKILVNSDGEKIRKGRPVDYDKELPNQTDPREMTGDEVKPPSNVSVSIEESKNVLSWDKNTNPNVVGYRIYRTNPVGFGYDKIGVKKQQNTNSERLYFEDPVSSTVPYVYYVTSVYVNGSESKPSQLVGSIDLFPNNPDDNDGPDGNNQDEPIEGIPSSPKGISSDYSNLNILLSWLANPSEENVTKYNIYYSPHKKADFVLIGSTDKNTFLFSQVPTGDAYFYITAVNEFGESKPSNIYHVKR